jgi:ABC-2 type transport system ATP-binding protein
MNAVIRALGSVDVRALTSTPPTLEELFLRHYDDHLAAEGRHS